MYPFKFGENKFKINNSADTSNVDDPSTASSVLNFLGKTFSCSPGIASTALQTRSNCSSDSTTPIKASFVDSCIDKTISFITGNHIDESPERYSNNNNSSNLLTPKFARPVTPHIDTPYPIKMLQDSHARTTKDQLCKSIEKASTYESKNTCNEEADAGDCRTDAKYVETLRRSRISNVSFKREYKPLTTKFREDSEIFGNPKRNIDKGLDSDEPIYEKNIDKILKFMNSDEYELAHVSADSLKSKLNAADIGNYSYYALFFMVISNFIGFGLSLTFQVLLFLKANADRFLNKSWVNWKSAGSWQCDNNMLTLILLIPVLILVCSAYGFIWACFGVNKFLLTTVPDRVAQMINFNVRIVTK